MRVEHSSKKSNWETPEIIFRPLHKEFGFTVDLCASKKNHKLPKFYNKQQDGLRQKISGERVWCNPPYGRKVTGKWIEKLANGGAEIAVALVPSRTDTKWFHNFIWQKRGVKIRFFKGRIKFVGAKSSAPFPSMLVIFRNKIKTP